MALKVCDSNSLTADLANNNSSPAKLEFMQINLIDMGPVYHVYPIILSCPCVYNFVRLLYTPGFPNIAGDIIAIAVILACA